MYQVYKVPSMVQQFAIVDDDEQQVLGLPAAHGLMDRVENVT